MVLPTGGFALLSIAGCCGPFLAYLGLITADALLLPQGLLPRRLSVPEDVVAVPLVTVGATPFSPVHVHVVVGQVSVEYFSIDIALNERADRFVLDGLSYMGFCLSPRGTLVITIRVRGVLQFSFKVTEPVVR